MLKNKSILITGGTGSFGREMVRHIFNHHEPKKVIVYSRDELKQYVMQQEWPIDSTKFPIRYFIGDVRDYERLLMAFEDIDIVIHAAALKQVPAAEYNPFEAIKTNILGAQNVINAALAKKIKKVIALSTDKAAAPINLYGATKLASDKLFVAANNHRGKSEIKFSVVRYGNVLGSRGSVVPFFLKQKGKGVLPITDKRMTRFNITLQDGVDFVMHCLDIMWGGEIFVPKIPSYKILDVAKAIAPKSKLIFTGIRPGEKLHEEMITLTDALNSIEFKKYFVILPSMPLWDIEKFRNNSSSTKGINCDFGFSYNSGTNKEFLSVSKLKQLIKDNI